MKIYQKDVMELHYMRIYERSKEKLLQGGVGDQFLLSPEKDTRMSLALLIRISAEISEKICAYLNDLRSSEPDLYYYPKEDFHITVMDILSGKPNRMIPDNIDHYIRCIMECADKIEPFYIAFSGMVASENAALVKGYYEYGLEKLRIILRKILLTIICCLRKDIKQSLHILQQ